MAFERFDKNNGFVQNQDQSLGGRIFFLERMKHWHLPIRLEKEIAWVHRKKLEKKLAESYTGMGGKGGLENAWNGSLDKRDLIWNVLLKPKLWEVHFTSVASMPSQIWEQPNMRQTWLVCFVNAINEWIYHQREWTFMIPIYFYGWCSLYVYRIGWFF